MQIRKRWHDGRNWLSEAALACVPTGDEELDELLFSFVDERKTYRDALNGGEVMVLYCASEALLESYQKIEERLSVLGNKIERTELNRIFDL